MKKGKAYVPFRFRLSPIKKMAMIHFHKNPDSEYEAFELHYINGEPYGEGFRVLAWRTDGYRDSYVQDTLTISEQEEILSIGGKGLKERYTVEFDEGYFEHANGQLDAGFVFNDKLGRRIVLYVDERVDKDTKPLTWLPSVGNHIQEPHSMPLFFLYNFDFARKRDTEIFLSIDGQVVEVDPFAFPKDFQARYYVEFSTYFLSNCLNRNVARRAMTAPPIMPAIILNGMEASSKAIDVSWPLVPSPRKKVNKVMANTSSIDVPARSKVGTCLSSPYSFSFRSSMLGTTTAGDTAAIMNPSIPASANEKLSR